MQTKTKYNKLFPVIILLVCIVVLYIIGCEKNELLKKPSVKTVQVESATATTANVIGEFIKINDYEVTEFGFCWSNTSNPTISDNKQIIDLQATNSNFGTQITDLYPDKKYYFKAFASNSVGIGYGEELTFTTENGNITLSTSEPSNITAKTASVGVTISDDGGSEIVERGICYDVSQNPTINDSKVQDNDGGTGTYSCSLNNLTPDTTYYIRAYATNEVGTSYSNEVNFNTEDGLPELTTAEITDITTSTAISGGNITDDGGFSILARGVCYSTEAIPTIDDSHTTNGSGTGSFQSNIEGIVIGTKYYLRAYASNEIGTAYGEELEFFTDIVDYDNNEYDVVIVGDQIWMAENLKTTHYSSGEPMVDGTGVGAIWGDTTTQYYFSYNDNDSYVETFGRLYTWAAAMNTPAQDVEYAFKIQGACPTHWRMPSDEDWLELEMELGMSEAEANDFGMRGTDEGSKLKSTSEWASGGNGTDEIGFSIYPAGWRNGEIFEDIYNYTHFWAGIEPYDLQCVDRWLKFDKGKIGRDGVGADRGYSIRCIYGPAAPTVATIEVTDIGVSSATVGSYVSSNGGRAVSELGIYYGTSKNPESTGTKVHIGAGQGTYTTNLNGLSPSTTYYVKAYAINSMGTSYGYETSFKTYNSTVNDYDGNVYYTVLIGDQEWMAENLKTTHYADGTEILLEESSWGTLTTSDKAYCYYDNSDANGDTYGALYNWAAAMNGTASSISNPSGVQGVCPDGWHLPSDAEWKELEMALGMSQADADAEEWRGTNQGLQLKSTFGWDNNGNGTNSSGLSFLPGAYRDQDGPFYDLLHSCVIWSSTEYNIDRAIFRSLDSGNDQVFRKNNNKLDGNSVRCIKD